MLRRRRREDKLTHWLMSTQARRRDHRPERHGRRDHLRLVVCGKEGVRPERVPGARGLSFFYFCDHFDHSWDRF